MKQADSGLPECVCTRYEFQDNFSSCVKALSDEKYKNMTAAHCCVADELVNLSSPSMRHRFIGTNNYADDERDDAAFQDSLRDYGAYVDDCDDGACVLSICAYQEMNQPC